MCVSSWDVIQSIECQADFQRLHLPRLCACASSWLSLRVYQCVSLAVNMGAYMNIHNTLVSFKEMWVSFHFTWVFFSLWVSFYDMLVSFHDMWASSSCIGGLFSRTVGLQSWSVGLFSWHVGLFPQNAGLFHDLWVSFNEIWVLNTTRFLKDSIASIGTQVQNYIFYMTTF